MARLSSPGRLAGGRPSRGLVRRAQDRLRLTPSRSQRAFLVLLAVVWVATPSYLSDYWLDVLARCGLAAIGAIGLNLLTGYTGQISLGHAFFIGVGAYVAAWFGVEQQMPLLVWLPLCAVVGGLIGAVIGPFALRLRGNYLAIVTVGLLYIGNLVFNNWTASPVATRAPRRPRPSRSGRSTSRTFTSSGRSGRAGRVCSGSSGCWSRSPPCWPRTSCGPGPDGRCKPFATRTSRPKWSG